jgi:hypothetical protein
MRFAVRRPNQRRASPRSHGVPRRDISSRVHVRVADVSTDGALEDGLALARLRVHPSAHRTALACMVRLNLLDPSGCLIFQAAHQQTPAGTQDAPVQASFGLNLLTGIIFSSLDGTRHVPNLQVLDSDQVELARQVRAGLLDPVLAPVRFARSHPGDGQPRLCASFRATLGAGKTPLQAMQPCLLSCGQSGREQQITRREGRGYRNASVDSDDMPVTRCLDRIRDRDEGHMPATRPIHGYPVGLYSWRQRPRPAKTHPPDLWHPNFTSIPAEPTHVPLLPTLPDDAEPFVPTSLSPRWLPIRPLRVEERGQRLGKVTQGLLLNHLGARAKPVIRCARCSELPALLHVTWRTLTARPPVGVLLDGQIPHVPGMCAVLPHHHLLGGSRKQPVSAHANTVTMRADIFGEVKRRFPSGLRARTSTSRFS